MTDPSIRLSSSLLADVFPFHFAINPEQRIVQFGDVLQRICPGLSKNSLFEQHFQIQRPKTPLNFDAVQAHLRSLFIIKIQDSSTLLKGQMIYVDEQQVLLFLGSPWISDLNELSTLDLALADFAIHDPIVDYLILLQAQKTALSDAQKLADKLKQQKLDVRKALEREKELNDLKSRFITTASHEFRTPLGIITSSAGIMQDYAAKISQEMQQKHLARIQSAIGRMTSLLDDVLTMNQVEAGTLKVRQCPLSIATFCQKIVTAFQEKTSHPITYKPESRLDDMVVMLDPNLLSQLLKNLLSNAIKYTPELSEIVLDLKYQNQQVILAVKDSGIGIPPGEETSIFDPFYRASNVGNIAGAGLGLAIVKHCVDLHGGEIKVESEVGFGTTVTVIFDQLHIENLDDTCTADCLDNSSISADVICSLSAYSERE